jgi:hypothetical protein
LSCYCCLLIAPNRTDAANPSSQGRSGSSRSP